MKKHITFLMLTFFAVISTMPATATEPIGTVTRLQGDVEAVAPDKSRRKLVLSSKILPKDIIVTDSNARIELTMIDDTIIVLSDQTRFTIDRYLYDEEAGTSNILMKLVDGAFRAITAKVGKLASPRLQVVTPYGIIGTRGTDFWGGHFRDDDTFGVLVLSGRGVYVTNRAGTVLLTKPGAGTDLSATDVAPTAPKKWGQKRIDKAVATVTFK